jgi:hypothetical protein
MVLSLSYLVVTIALAATAVSLLPAPAPLPGAVQLVLGESPRLFRPLIRYQTNHYYPALQQLPVLLIHI